MTHSRFFYWARQAIFKGLEYVAVVIVLGPTLLTIYRDRPVADPFSYFVWDEDTTCARAYSERRFGKITTGQSQEEVYQSLGPPMVREAWCEGSIVRIEVSFRDHTWTSYRSEQEVGCKVDKVVWRYCFEGQYSNYYFARDLSFDASNRVTSVRREVED